MRKIIRRKLIGGAFLLVLVLLVGLVLADDRQPAENSQLPDIIKGLNSALWKERVDAAQVLPSMDNVELSRVVDLLVEVLNNEIHTPLSEDKPIGNYMTITELLKREYILALVRLGDRGKSRLHVLKDSSSGELKKRLIIALGLQKDDSVYVELKEILSSERDGYLRTLAARALGEIENPDAIPVLKAALKDSFVVKIKSDLIGPGGNLVYPVRNEAAGALRRLGVNLKRDGIK